MLTRRDQIATNRADECTIAVATQIDIAEQGGADGGNREQGPTPIPYECVIREVASCSANGELEKRVR